MIERCITPMQKINERQFDLRETVKDLSCELEAVINILVKNKSATKKEIIKEITKLKNKPV